MMSLHTCMKGGLQGTLREARKTQLPGYIAVLLCNWLPGREKCSECVERYQSGLIPPNGVSAHREKEDWRR